MQTSVATYNTTIPALFYGGNFCGERKLSWDEENRLRSICDNGYVSSYFYDAGGARTVKLHGSGEGIHANAAFSGGYTNNTDYTLYVDAYMVLEKGGQYTKHIYIGDQRIVSKLGDVGSFGVDPRREQYAGEDVAGVEVPNYKTKYEALQNVIKDNYQLFEVDYYGVDNDNYVDGEGFCCEPKTQSKNARSLPAENVDYEKLQYYYHSDHLGSASYITNLDGEVVQHIEYVPFGEVFLEERNNTWNTPYLFNGKELDEETGLYYYGARYYNPRISLWYGVDPLAEKYPAHSPYCYTMNNPVMLIDPDGRSTEVTDNGNGTYKVVGGNLNDKDKGIYIVTQNKDGSYSRTEGDPIGESLTMYSFYNADTWDAEEGMKIGWVGTIDPKSTESRDLVSKFIKKAGYIFIGTYMLNATNGRDYDFKRDGNPDNEDRDFHHRGSVFDTKSDGTLIFASARDAGNYSAGYIAGINDLSWGTTRFGFDSFEFSKSGNIEGLQSTLAQRLGHDRGYPIGRANTFEREFQKAINPWPIGPKF